MKRFFAFLILACTIQLSSAIPVMAGDQPVTGSFLGNGQEAKLAFANARAGEPFSGKETVVVVLTEKDPGAEKRPDMKALFGKYGSALILTITRSGEIIGCDISHAAHPKKPFSSIGKIKLTDFRIDQGSVQGKVSTGGEDKFFDQTWSVDLSFNAKLQ